MSAEEIFNDAVHRLGAEGKKLLLNPLKSMKRSAKKVALPPGSIVYVGEERTVTPKIYAIDYDKDHFVEGVVESTSEYFSSSKHKGVSWLNVDGVHDVGIIEEIGKHYEVHPLVLEDLVHTSQRPKVEEDENYLYIVLKMFYLDSHRTIQHEQVSLILGKHFLCSFQEKPGDIFDPIRARIKNAKGRIRIGGADYLAYALLDAIVDHYFVVLENIGETLETLEEEISANPEPSVLNKIHKVKRELLFLRKSIWPLREVVNQLLRSEFQFIQDATQVYLKDLYDHTIQVVETTESFHDMASGLQDLYMTVISTRMNDVMKVLTIIATLFIPPTFIAGIYGMNFDNMPELHTQYGYMIVLSTIGLSILGMVIFFKKKKWF